MHPAWHGEKSGLDLVIMVVPFDLPSVLSDEAEVVVLPNDGSDMFGEMRQFDVPADQPLS